MGDVDQGRTSRIARLRRRTSSSGATPHRGSQLRSRETPMLIPRARPGTAARFRRTASLPEPDVRSEQMFEVRQNRQVEVFKRKDALLGWQLKKWRWPLAYMSKEVPV